ncbi:MAG: hypothetical protein ACRDQD_29565 [Nocardioidaceae bacterium]
MTTSDHPNPGPSYGTERSDVTYLGTLIGDARTHLEAAQSALATATAWTAIMLDRDDEDRSE